jgi:alcohol dehydrogenase class IV
MPSEYASFQFYRTPRVRFGAGAFAALAEEVARLGTKVLVVTGASSLRASGRLDRLLRSLDERSLAHAVVEMSGEPSPERVDEAVEAVRDERISVVLAVGGGSVVDAGKAISAMLPCAGSVRSYVEVVGDHAHPGEKLPFIAVPTTAGTGSEATKNAVLSRVGLDGFKASLRHDNFVPDLAAIDPELALSCPAEITAACGMDALSQLLESYVSTRASPLTDSLAVDGLRRAAGSLVAVCTTGAGDLEARASMAHASFVSGITLANAGLGVIHGFAAPIGGFFPIPHGVVCGSLLAPAVRITIEKLREGDPEHAPALGKFAAVGALVAGGVPGVPCDVAGGCDALVDWLYGLAEKLAIPRLSDYGVSASDCDRIIERSGSKNNPVPLDREEMRRILLERI